MDFSSVRSPAQKHCLGGKRRQLCETMQTLFPASSLKISKLHISAHSYHKQTIMVSIPIIFEVPEIIFGNCENMFSEIADL